MKLNLASLASQSAPAPTRSAIEKAGDFVFLHDEPVASDAIVIPGSGAAELGEKAAELFRAGLAPLIVVSGKHSSTTQRFAGPATKKDVYTGTWQTESAFLRAVMEKNGVPATAILEESEATKTVDNGRLTRALLDAKGITLRTAIIVCKPYHARRALLAYQAAFPDTRFVVTPYDDPSFNRQNFMATDKGVEKVLTEVRLAGRYAPAALAALVTTGTGRGVVQAVSAVGGALKRVRGR